MNISKRATVGCLGILGVTLIAGALVVLKGDRVLAALGAQEGRVRATLFRLGEVMSISAALKTEYGPTIDAGYVTSSGTRILRITCTDCDLPQETTAEEHARGIAVAAIGETKKHDQIDTVEIVFRLSAEGEATEITEPYSFTLKELARDR